jgi:hypothetical protein
MQLEKLVEELEVLTGQRSELATQANIAVQAANAANVKARDAAAAAANAAVPATEDEDEDATEDDDAAAAATTTVVEDEEEEEEEESSAAMSEVEKWCAETGKKYGVVPYQSFGSMPVKLNPVWRERHCNDVMETLQAAEQ